MPSPQVQQIAWEAWQLATAADRAISRLHHTPLTWGDLLSGEVRLGVDKSALKKALARLDRLVADGFGGDEYRFTSDQLTVNAVRNLVGDVLQRCEGYKDRI
jgi:hypothetical protein